MDTIQILQIINVINVILLAHYAQENYHQIAYNALELDIYMELHV